MFGMAGSKEGRYSEIMGDTLGRDCTGQVRSCGSIRAAYAKATRLITIWYKEGVFAGLPEATCQNYDEGWYESWDVR